MDAQSMFEKALLKGSHHNQFNSLLPDYRLLRLLGRSLFLVVAILSLPCFSRLPGFFQSGVNSRIPIDDLPVQPKPEELIPTVFKDLLNQGLVKPGGKALLTGGSLADVNGIRTFMDQGIIPPLDIIVGTTSDQSGSFIADETMVEFIFTANGFDSAPLIERALKIHGVAVLRFSSRSDFFRVPPNYKIVYLRRLNSAASDMVMAVSKIRGKTQAAVDSETAPRRPGLCSITDAKQRGLRQLEDLLLEPPRDKWVKSRGYLKHVKYMPNLMGDDLSSYSRHVYVEVGSRRGHGGGVAQWFRESYPLKGRDFDVYALEGDAAGKYSPIVSWTRKGGAVGMGAIGLSDWLKNNVAAEEYVVMKVEVGGGREFELVREMVRTKAVCLVDELFLVCDHEGKGGNNGSRRAYWECLSLYGMLREERVAVHQWWG